ncbi:MAG: hypothetical protein ABSG17_01745 [Spirochaetia bacterium]
MNNDQPGVYLCREGNDGLLRPSSLQPFCSNKAKTARFFKSLSQCRFPSLLFGSVQLALSFMVRVQWTSQPVQIVTRPHINDMKEHKLVTFPRHRRDLAHQLASATDANCTQDTHATSSKS